MGFALCRFKTKTGCQETGSREWHIQLADLKVGINLPSMWKHYMQVHKVQPTAREREIIMSADPKYATGQCFTTRGMNTYPEEKILYVEKLENGYTHQTSEIVDEEFIVKLESLLQGIEPWQTKGSSLGLDTRPGYR